MGLVFPDANPNAAIYYRSSGNDIIVRDSYGSLTEIIKRSSDRGREYADSDLFDLGHEEERLEELAQTRKQLLEKLPSKQATPATSVRVQKNQYQNDEAFKVDVIECSDSQSFKQIVSLLVDESCWFKVTPLPDDEYEIVVKAEGHAERAVRQLSS